MNHWASCCFMSSSQFYLSICASSMEKHQLL